MTLDEGGSNSVKNSLLFFADLVTEKEPQKQGCQTKIQQGCFPFGFGGSACQDIDTCPESSK